ncbi:two-partner secretion domain-containing protein [Paraburkholderia antibiotica]|uniref:two-partner secretion domain-containing protein n=1 Tax=Paraburkholderia antibiotica TaxID=2728839 RepID=UPI002E32B44E|nr:filamentous hemagglutinin N-terminal domain-containing protein [Paraburkholderia antibiotica]
MKPSFTVAPHTSCDTSRYFQCGTRRCWRLAWLPRWLQVTAAGAHAPTVIQTANGIDQVNINRPSGAGVSQNSYSQFVVPKAGAILNNSPTIVQTQQAGQINGNANLLPRQSARIILNQVNSNSPSQLRGFLEVTGHFATDRGSRRKNARTFKM